jgi:hypothetical protein
VMRHDPETAELDDGRRFRREIHSRGTIRPFQGVRPSSVLFEEQA